MNDYRSIFDRLKLFFNVNSDRKVAERLKINYNTIKTWSNRKKIPLDTLLSLIQNETINIDWLLTGKGSMHTNDNSLQKTDDSDTIEIDKLSLKASAGTGIENFEVEVEDKLSISKTFFKTPQNPQNLKIIQIIGDSMEPTLQDGSFIVIDISKKGGIDGIYALLLQNEVLVKRLQFNLDKTINIISDNPTYKTQQYDPKETQIPLKILGMKILTIQ